MNDDLYDSCINLNEKITLFEEKSIVNFTLNPYKSIIEVILKYNKTLENQVKVRVFYENINKNEESMNVCRLLKKANGINHFHRFLFKCHHSKISIQKIYYQILLNQNSINNVQVCHLRS